MKKTLVSALAATLVVGAASTTFAAANPFSDVPTDHWAYDAVAQLARDGVIEGYGDTTFQGESAITRYEMAQMIAKAMAKQDQANAADKAMIDKLAAEFSDELNNLGVRVSNLEKKMDNVHWEGMLRYSWHGLKNDGEKRGSSNQLKLRLEPTMTVNDHWNIKALADIDKNNNHVSHDGELIGDSDSAFNQCRVYVSGKYGNTTYDIGRVGLYTEQGMVADDEYTGLKVTNDAGKLNTRVYAGRMNQQTSVFQGQTAGWKDTRHGDFYGTELTYQADQTFTGNLGYYYLKNKNLKYGVDSFKDSKPYGEDHLSLWQVGGTYNFTKDWSLIGIYVGNAVGDQPSSLSHAYNAQLQYGHADLAKKGSFDVYGAYRYLGNYATIVPTYDCSVYGAKGWELGLDYVVMKNVIAYAYYFDGKYIDSDFAATQSTSGKRDVNQLFGRVELYF